MSFARIKKRQQQKGVNLFNELMIVFTSFINKTHVEHNGLLVIDEETDQEFNKLNNTWRRFVNNNRRNPKKKIDYAVKAFQDRAEQYIKNLKKQIWMKYMIGFMDERYGIDISYQELESYYVEDRDPEESAVKIVMDIPTINYEPCTL